MARATTKPAASRSGRARRGGTAALITLLGLGFGLWAGHHTVGREPHAGEARGARRLPDILVILVDTLRADHLGMYGYAKPTSPFLDDFARRNLFFPQNRSQAGCTFPSANSVLTSRDPSVFLGQPRNRVGLLPDTTSIAEILRSAGYATIAASASPIVRRHPSPHNRFGGFDQGFDVFDDSCHGSRGGCLNRALLAAVDSLPEDRSAFLYVHFMEPHAPYKPNVKERQRFIEPSAEVPEWVRRGDLNPLREQLYEKGPVVPWSDAALRFSMGLYDAEIAAVDGAIEVLLTELQRRGRLERTLVAFVSDHGEEFLEHGHIYHCRTVFDSSVRTPMVLSLPDVPGGRVFDAPVENLDLLPTLLDFAGVPAGPSAASFAGRSLRPLIEGEGGAAGAAERYAFSSQHHWRAVTDGRHKLILNLRSRAFQLFDLVADPAEQRDVLDQERRIFRRLQAVLLDRLQRFEAEGDSVKKADEALEALRALGYL